MDGDIIGTVAGEPIHFVNDDVFERVRFDVPEEALQVGAVRATSRLARIDELLNDDRTEYVGLLLVRRSLRGSVVQDLASLTIPVDEWRKIARAAGRELGRPVQTLIAGDSVHAVLRDWPRDEREQAIHNQAMRAAMNAVSLDFSAYELDRPGVPLV